MSNKNLTILGIIAAVMVTLTILQTRVSNHIPQDPQLNTPLIQGLNTADIATIELGNADETVTIKRAENNFIVTNKDNYPALISKLNNLITSCLDIHVNQFITANPANHADLEVTDQTAKNIVKFLDADGQLITGIIVGKRDPQAGGTYVRKIADDQNTSNRVYISSNVRWLQMSPLSYVEKQLFMVEKEDITDVTVNTPNSSYTITTDDDNNITLQNIPQGKKPKANDYQQVFTAVTNLELSDLQKESKKTADLNFDITYTCRLKDSTLCTFNLARKDDKTFLKCSSRFTDTTPITMERGTVESTEELEQKEAKLLARDAAQQFNAKHKGWIYEIPSYKADYMTKNLDDLLQDIEKPKQQESPPPQNQ